MAEGAELLTECETLEGELGPGAECRAERRKQAEEQGKPGWMMHDGA